MMTRAQRALTVVGLAAGAAACALVAGIPDDVTVDPCPRPIQVRFLSALNDKTVADIALPFYLGTTDRLREIQAQGGIKGCPVEYTSVETSYNDAAKAAEAYEGWKKEPTWKDVVAVFGVGSADALELGPKCAADQRVFVSTAYNGTLASPLKLRGEIRDVPTSRFLEDGGVEETLREDFDVSANGYPYVFFAGTDYSTAARAALYHVRTVSGAGTVVGWVHCSLGEFCLNPLRAGKHYAAEQELVVGRELVLELDARQEDYTEAIRKYVENEAVLEANRTTPVKWLWAGNLTGGTFFLARALDEVARSGSSDAVKAIANGMTIIANNYGFDEGLAAGLCPTAPDACRRIRGVMPFAAYGDRRASGMGEVLRLHDKYRALAIEEGGAPVVVGVGGRPPLTQSVRYVQGYMNVELFRMAVERTIARGLQVTGANLKATLETFSDESTGNLTEGLTFTPSDHRPQSKIAVYSVDVPEAGTPTLKFELVKEFKLKREWLGW